MESTNSGSQITFCANLTSFLKSTRKTSFRNTPLGFQHDSFTSYQFAQNMCPINPCRTWFHECWLSDFPKSTRFGNCFVWNKHKSDCCEFWPTRGIFCVDFKNVVRNNFRATFGFQILIFLESNLESKNQKLEPKATSNPKSDITNEFYAKNYP